MFSFLLAIIYISFISLGLPDSLLGSGWPEMHRDLHVNLASAGLITMIISFCTIISSLMSDRLVAKFNTKLVTAFCVLITAIGMLGFSVCHNYYLLCLLAIPYGLGAGSIDAALNNYVALHYSAKHMSWLHASWGLGATISPYIMSFCLLKKLGWFMGYRTVGFIQLGLAIFLFATLSVWESEKHEKVEHKILSVKEAFKIKGVPYIMLGFFCYCAAEGCGIFWSSTYFALGMKISKEIAAALGSSFFIGLTSARFLSGFITEKFGDKQMIRYGTCLILFGLALMLTYNFYVSVFGILLVGFGMAPIYPAIIHSTPYVFGKENSQSLVGMQMASAYSGITFIPPVFGLLAQYVNVKLYPVFILLFVLVMYFSIERLNLIVKKKNK